jgi:sugar/nucleoside kinase (ribokinase family)
MIWIAGAVCLDIVAMRTRFIDGTSNPSSFRLGVGGVGYNIFRSCTAPARFITALGRDQISGIAREALRGNPAVLIRDFEEGRPAVYAAFMEDGRLKVGASDLSALENGLDAAFLIEAIGEPDAGDFLVLDGNLSAHAVRGTVERLAARVRILFEPVSVEKSLRHRASLPGCWLSTPSEKETAALVRGDDARGPLPEESNQSGDPGITDDEVFAWMHEAGSENLLVTRGERGTSLYTGGTRRDFPPGRVVRTKDSTGAGDLLVASLLGFLHQGRGLREAITPAMAVVESALGKGKT